MEEIFYKLPKGTGLRGKYEISKSGRVMAVFDGRGYKSGRILSVRANRNGYYYVNLFRNDGKRKTFKIHRLVALTFIKNPHKKKFINHKNGIKTDNRIVNLEWCTGSENMKHAISTGLMKPLRGEDTSSAKLSNAQVLEIFNASGVHREIAMRFSINQRMVSFIKSGASWSHITGKVYHRRRLAEEDVREMRNLYNKGTSVKELSVTYHRSLNHIRGLVSGKRWESVTLV